MKDALRPMQDPNAPLMACDDCRATGRHDCRECEGSGLLASQRHIYDPVVEYRCDGCDGKGDVECIVCDGTGSYEDPEALLECPDCAEFLDADSGACMLLCGYVRPSMRKAGAA